MPLSNDKDKQRFRSVTGPSPPGKSALPSVQPRQRRPKYTGTELRKALTAYDRQPFTDLLLEWFAECPRPEDIRQLAEKDPQKWVQSMASLAKMAGYTDKTETSVDVTVNYKGLSDSQIEDRLRQLANRVGLPVNRLMTIQAEPLDPEKPAQMTEPSAHSEFEPEHITPEDIKDELPGQEPTSGI
jgi:hypothetical protein